MKVLWSPKKFLEVSNNFWNFETVLGSFQKFLEVSNSSWKSQKVLRSLENFSKPQIVLQSFKQFWKSQRVLGSFKEFSGVSKRVLQNLLGFWKSSRCYQRVLAQPFSSTKTLWVFAVAEHWSITLGSIPVQIWGMFLL